MIQADLFDKELVAVDGTKIRTQNSKKNNLSEEKINKRQGYAPEQLKAMKEHSEQLERQRTPANRRQSQGRRQRAAIPPVG